MSEALIRIDVSALSERAVEGVSVVQADPALQTLLRTRLSGEHAALFAEPRREAAGIAWFARTGGAVVAVAGLSLRDRTAALRRIDRLLGDVRTMADRIRGESSDLRRLAKILTAVAQPPPPQWVWRVGDQVVMGGWSHEPPALFTPATTAPSAVMATLDGSKAVRGDASPRPHSPAPTVDPAAMPPDPGRRIAPLLLVAFPPLLVIALGGWLLWWQVPLLPAPEQQGRIALLRLQLAGPPVAPAACSQKPQP